MGSRRRDARLVVVAAELRVGGDHGAPAGRLHLRRPPARRQRLLAGGVDDPGDRAVRRHADRRACRGTSRASSARCSTPAPTASSCRWSTPASRPRRSCDRRATRPTGSRSWGPVMAGMRHDDNRAWADAHVATIPMIETAEAIENLDEILSVPGVDAIYVGPADLSISLGLEPGQQRRQAPCSTTRSATIVAACQRHGVVPGIHASGPLTPRPPRAGLPDDHRHERRAGDPRRLHQRTRRGPW